MKIIPIFFAVNDEYAPFLAVALTSLFENCNKNYFYKIHIIEDNISNINKEKIKKFNLKSDKK